MEFTAKESSAITSRLTVSEQTPHVQATTEEAIEIGRAAARRWVTEGANAAELLHAVDHVNTGSQAFQRGFVDGLQESLIQARSLMRQPRKPTKK